MNSSLADQNHKALIDAARRMTPAERLKAFSEHSRLMIELREAGIRHRSRSRKPPSSKK